MTLHTNACLAIHQLTQNLLCRVLEYKSQTFAKTLIHNHATHHAISLIAVLWLSVLYMINLGLHPVSPQTLASSAISAIVSESLYLFAGFDMIFNPWLLTSPPNLSPRLSAQEWKDLITLPDYCSVSRHCVLKKQHQLHIAHIQDSTHTNTKGMEIVADTIAVKTRYLFIHITYSLEKPLNTSKCWHLLLISCRCPYANEPSCCKHF